MSWTKHHDKTPDSLTVKHGMTDRMSKMQVVVTEATLTIQLDVPS